MSLYTISMVKKALTPTNSKNNCDELKQKGLLSSWDYFWQDSEAATKDVP